MYVLCASHAHGTDTSGAEIVFPKLHLMFFGHLAPINLHLLELKMNELRCEPTDILAKKSREWWTRKFVHGGDKRRKRMSLLLK